MDFKSIVTIQHPDFAYMTSQWQKFRDVMEGGPNFIDKYLVRFSLRETSVEFEERKSISYCAAYVKSTLFKIKNAMFQRFSDIVRSGGSESYQNAVKGLNYGVDGAGLSMNTFVAKYLVEELLVLKRVGVYIDKDPLHDSKTLAETKNTTPYLYPYSAEYIQSWLINSKNELQAILLVDAIDDIETESGLVKGTVQQFRYLKLLDNNEGVSVTLINENGEVIEETILEIPRIPFVFFEIPQSLLQDVADYQVALTNLGSSDMSYSLKANFPFYTEQFNPVTQMPHIKEGVDASEDDAGTSAGANASEGKQIKVGVTKGRQYGKGLDRPEFINPSSEPLAISMEKQKKLEQDIEVLMGINLAAVGTGSEVLSPEAGLSFVAMILEAGENEIAKIWNLYDGSAQKPAVVEYPDRFYLISDEDRRKEADELSELLPRVPSITFQRESVKRIVDLVLGSKISSEAQKTMLSELDSAEVVVIDPEVITKDMQNGLIGTELASSARGYPDGEVEKAKQDRAERAAAVALAQSEAGQTGVANMENAGARGVTDLSVDPTEEANKEKQLSQDSSQNVAGVGKKVRGDAK